MYTESMQIAELFRNPRNVQRATPFSRVISRTYGKGRPEFSQAAPPSPDGPDPGPPTPPPHVSAPRPDEYWGFY